MLELNCSVYLLLLVFLARALSVLLVIYHFFYSDV